MPIESDQLRQAMRFWATGVTVVTAAHAGRQHGMTVSAFTSVSLDPPQVLISLAKEARTHELVLQSHHFGLTVLEASQQEIADRFAGRAPDDTDRLKGLETITLVSGTPLLKQGLTQLDCRVVSTLDTGKQTIFIAEVLAAQSVESGEPLLYFNRDYRKMQKS